MPVRQTVPNPPALSKRVEWPTLLVALLIYSGYALLTLNYRALPLYILLPAAGFIVAWHGSLQHEVVHGHPTPWRWLNLLLVFPSLWLWLPFTCYQRAHQIHHRDEYLTDPSQDPESYYLYPQNWQSMPSPLRGVHNVLNTSIGRLLLGPVFSVIGFGCEQVQCWRNGHFEVRAWLLHSVCCALVLYWVIGVCQIPLLEYLLVFAYPGLSLTLLRSYAEHQARPVVSERTTAVEAGWLMSLLYLNNNLHPMHHEQPGLAWYLLPTAWRENRNRLLTANGGNSYPGYAKLIATYAFNQRENPCWPLSPTHRSVLKRNPVE